jgi:hypothetical protein
MLSVLVLYGFMATTHYALSHKTEGLNIVTCFHRLLCSSNPEAQLAVAGEEISLHYVMSCPVP